MSGLIMFVLIIGVIYVAFTYLKGPRNSDAYRNGFGMRPFNDGAFKGDTWHDDVLPELPENDETEMEPDGEDMEEIGFESDEAEGLNEIPADKSDTIENVVPVPTVPAAVPPAAPAIAVPEVPSVPEASAVTGVVVDSEVRMDAEMPSDNKK